MRHRRTQEALLASALRAPEILEFMSEGFISFDRKWKYRYINRRAEEIFGVSRDHLVGRSLSDAYPGAVGEEFRSLVRRADRERVVLSFEGKHPILDRVYQSNVYPTLDGVAVFFRDITAEKHSDEVRSRLAERLEMAQRAAMAADWRWNFQTGKMDCSSNFGEVLGFGPDEPITRDTWVGHVHPAEREAIEASVKEIAKGSADRFQLEYRILGSDGQSRWMQSRGMLERSTDGKATGAVGITLDITEKKMAELALRESEERFRTLSEVVPQLVWQADADGLIDYWNQRTYAYTGQTASEAAGWGWAAAVHPEDRARVAASWEAAIKEQAIFDIEYRIRRHDGEYRWFVGRGQPVRDASGRIVRWFGTCTDITYRRSVETALQESEERYRAIFEQASVGVALVALDGRYLEVNNRFCEITGYSAEELRHLSFRDLTHPDDLQSSLEETDKLIAGLTQRCALKNRHIRKDGRITWMYMTHALVRNAPGRPQYMIWVIEDINDRERIQLQLQEQSQRLEAALTASKTGTFRWGVRTNEFQADENLHRLFGLPPGETAHGLDEFNSLIVEEDRARVIECRNRAVREGGHFENVFRVIWPDGTLHWLRGRGKTFFDERGQPANMTGACVEITEQMEAQQQLQKTQELLLLAQAAAGVGTLEWDLITGRGRESPEMYRMYGISEQQDDLTVKERLKLIHPDDRPKIAEVWEHLVRGDQDKAEVEFRVGSGPGMRWVSWRGHVLRDGSGRAIRIVGAGFDVTERRRAEQVLLTHEKLTAAGRLSTSIAHELNNPLETVANVLHLIRNCSSLEEVQKYSRIGERELQRIIHTTRQTLRFHRQSAFPIPIKVSAIVDAIAGLYEHRFHGANIELKRDFRDTQPITCFADDLRQLFGNLISNALDATPSGGRVVLRVSEGTNYRTAEPGRRVSIADTGHGMSREIKDRLFEPFSSTKDLTGIGLGLWISFGIVKRHGGTIRIRSSEKENRHGTVVSVFLPARPSHVAARRAA
jgi:PAS domain S-box-containing protein